jgi:hypothetical protein
MVDIDDMDDMEICGYGDMEIWRYGDMDDMDNMDDMCLPAYGRARHGCDDPRSQTSKKA